QHQEGQLPTEVSERVLAPGSYKLHQLLVALGLAPSSSEGARLVRQGAVRLDGEAVDGAGVGEAAPEGVMLGGKRGDRARQPSLVVSAGARRNGRAVPPPN